MTERWRLAERPGFFGRRKNEKIAELDRKYGEGNWRLAHLVVPTLDVAEEALLKATFIPQGCIYDFVPACKQLYEESYFRYMKDKIDLIVTVCQYAEVYDNDAGNVQSGLDYTRQESYSTHIQDIAIRNVLDRLGTWFKGKKSGPYLQVRGPESEGYKLGLNPGQVPFFDPNLIIQPSLAPSWAGKNSVEDLWQSNKACLVKV